MSQPDKVLFFLGGAEIIRDALSKELCKNGKVFFQMSLLFISGNCPDSFQLMLGALLQGKDGLFAKSTKYLSFFSFGEHQHPLLPRESLGA